MKIEKKFIITPRFIDQIAYHTQKDQVNELANIFGCHNYFNDNESQETYSRLYNMLTSVMNKTVQNN